MIAIVALILAVGVSSPQPLNPQDPKRMTYTAPGTGAAHRTVYNKIGDVVSVKDFCGDTIPTNATSCLQAAVTAVSNSGTQAGKNLYIPSGTYNYSTQILANQLRTITVYGDGNRNTILHWTGSAGGTAFLCRNCYRVTIRGIRFDRATNDPDILLELQEDSTQGDYDGSAPSQLDTVEECTFKNGAVGLAVDFVGPDIMNDTHRFVHNILDGQTSTAFSISGQNAMGLNFYQNYSTSAPHAVQVQANAGSFKWFGGYTSSTISNFDFLSMNSDGYMIVGARSESSPRFLSCATGSALGAPVVLSGISYSAASLNADTFAISTTGGGPYTITGGMWGGAGANDPVAPRFSIANTSAFPIPIFMSGNAFGAQNADAAPPIVASTGNRVCAQGNRFRIGVTSTWTTKPEECFASVPREVTLTYTSGVAIPIDASTGTLFKLVVSDTVAVVLNSPTNGVAWQTIQLQVKATAAMNAANPFAGTGWRAGTVPIPTTGNGYIYTFLYDGVSWYQVGTPNLVAN